jgi:hypothetical protein
MAEDTEDENIGSQSSTEIRRCRKKRQLGQNNLSLSDDLESISLSTQRQQQPILYEEFDLIRFLESDTSFSIPTQAPSKIEPVTTPPVVVTLVPTEFPTLSPSSQSPTPSGISTPSPTEETPSPTEATPPPTKATPRPTKATPRPIQVTSSPTEVS